MRKISAIITVLMMSFLLAACSGKSVREGVGVDERNTGENGSGSSSTGINDGTAGGGQNVGSDGTDGTAGSGDGTGALDPLSQMVIYFEYDSASLTEESREVVEAHASNMGGNPNMVLLLEGHADERGTREYNVALGEERAQSVARLMQALGVEGGRLGTVSFGEERPAMIGDGEESWGKNRRVELVFTN